MKVYQLNYIDDHNEKKERLLVIVADKYQDYYGE